jgi:glucose-6-phosphate isomerase
LQKKDEKGNAEEVRLLKAKEGDKIIIPAEFGHIMINPSKTQTLITLNVLERTFRNDYKPFIEKKGGAYYELAEGFVANKNYGRPPRIKVLKPIEMAGFPKNKCLYRIFAENPESFMFLAAPVKLAQAQPKPEEKH